jgi:VanZ family protein
LKKNQLAILAALTWSLITTVLLCLPGSAFPKENWFDKIWLDKWIHIGIFTLMVFLWCRSITTLTEKKSILFIQVAFYFFLYGIAMEFVQKYFIPNRSFDIGDIIADGVGSIMGLIISLKLYIKK